MTSRPNLEHLLIRIEDLKCGEGSNQSSFSNANESRGITGAMRDYKSFYIFRVSKEPRHSNWSGVPGYKVTMC